MKAWAILLLLAVLPALGLGACATIKGPPLEIRTDSPAVTGQPEQDSLAPHVTAEPVPSTAGPLVRVTATRLNLRMSPSAKSRILSVLERGESLEVLAMEKHWARVRTPRQLEGWVHGRYLTPFDPKAIPGIKKTPSRDTPEPASDKKKIRKPKKIRSKTRPEGVTQAFIVRLYERYRRAIAQEDLETIVSLTYTPTEGSAKPTAEQLAEMREQFAKVKGFLTVIYPDLSTSKVLKFYQNTQAAMLIFQTDLHAEKEIHLSAVKFLKSRGEWKIVSNVEGNTLPKEDTDRDKETITAELQANPMFQLSAPAKITKPRKADRATLNHPRSVPSSVGKAKGQLIVNGKSTALRHGYALVQSSPFDVQKEMIIIIISNIPLSDKALLDGNERTKLERVGKLHGLELTINPDMAMVSTRVYHPAFKASPTGLSAHEICELTKGKNDIVHGKVYAKKPLSFFNTTYQYSAAFRAAVLREKSSIPRP